MLEVVVSLRACAWSLDLGQVVCAGGIHRARPLAVLQAVLWVAAHDSRPASYPTNVACNSPDTVSHRATILLGLQRLRTLLKVHPIELHAKLLRARASCLRSSPRAWIRWYAPGSDTSRVGLMVCVWVRHFARGSDGMRVGSAAQAHI